MRGFGPLLLVLGAVALGQARAAESPGAQHGSVAILNYGFAPTLAKTSVTCMSHALGKLKHGIEVVPAEKALDAFYPWLEVAMDSDAALQVLASQKVSAQAREAGVDVILVLTHAGAESHMKGPFFCGGGYGGAGCLGGATLNRQSEMTALIWDLRRPQESRQIVAMGRAHDLLLGLILPVWIPGGRSTKTLACEDMAGAIDHVLFADADTLRADTRIGRAGSSSTSTSPASAQDYQPTPGEWACLRAPGADSSVATPGEEQPAQTIDGVQWFDRVGSLADFTDPRMAAAESRVGRLALTADRITFASADQAWEARYGDLASATVLNGPTTLVAVETISGCRAAFQVLDPDAKMVKAQTGRLGQALAARLGGNHTEGVERAR